MEAAVKSIKKETKSTTKFNSVQLNLVTFVDVEKADKSDSLEGATYMIDNNVNSIGQGTNALQTVCKQGQVLNWIIYAMDSKKRPDGSWPPSVRINNIVFMNEQGNDVASFRVCEDLKLIGGPDKVRSKFTPVYFYWAGIVADDIPEGVYKYRLILELDTKSPNSATGKKYLNLDSQSLRVQAI